MDQIESKAGDVIEMFTMRAGCWKKKKVLCIMSGKCGFAETLFCCYLQVHSHLLNKSLIKHVH